MGSMTMTASTAVQGLSAIDASTFTNDGDRTDALLAAYALVSRLESPWETIARLCMNQPAVEASLKVARDVALFEKWHESGDHPASSTELARMVGIEPELLARILRHLAANHLLKEPSEDVFEPTTFTLALLKPVFGEWISHLYDATGPCFDQVPEYLKQTGYKSPTNAADGVFQHVKGFKGDLFEYYKLNPREGKSFNYVMGGVMATQASWLDIIPAETFLHGADPTLPLVVDIGGNVGHDIEKFRKVYPETAARLYLEDLPAVVSLSQVPEPVNKLPHNFFLPQPIAHSRVYYMHGVIHDWSDEPARKILQALHGAFKKGYSKLLIHDHVVSNKAPHPHATSYDLTMMVMVAGLERTEAEWHALLNSAGYNIVKIWRSSLAAQAVIEAEII